MTVEEKREKEKRIVAEMISLYCRKNHHSSGGTLCPECEKLKEYAQERSDHCPFMAEKTFCSNCRIHCYSQEKREQIKQVMRFSGPRMIFYHPVLAVEHLVLSRKEKKDLPG